MKLKLKHIMHLVVPGLRPYQAQLTQVPHSYDLPPKYQLRIFRFPFAVLSRLVFSAQFLTSRLPSGVLQMLILAPSANKSFFYFLASFNFQLTFLSSLVLTIPTAFKNIVSLLGMHVLRLEYIINCNCKFYYLFM